jgi:hypothetical protein
MEFMTAKTEKLTESSKIVLFGRIVEDLSYSGTDPAYRDNNFARIYGFTYDGAYFEMATPVLFTVEGKGEDAKDAPVPGPNTRDKEFVESLLFWSVDQTKKTVRLDVEIGKFENLLLDSSGDGGMGLSGARVSGARVSGARVSGARVSGARVSGARVCGARGDASD